MKLNKALFALSTLAFTAISSFNIANAAGLYRNSQGTVVFANDSGAFCSFISQAHFEILGGRQDLVRNVDSRSLSALQDEGPCAVYLPAGAYQLANNIVINSNGHAYCYYTSQNHYLRADRRPVTRLTGEVPLSAMQNHGACPG